MVSVKVHSLSYVTIASESNRAPSPRFREYPPFVLEVHRRAIRAEHVPPRVQDRRPAPNPVHAHQPSQLLLLRPGPPRVRLPPRRPHPRGPRPDHIRPGSVRLFRRRRRGDVGTYVPAAGRRRFPIHRPSRRAAVVRAYDRDLLGPAVQLRASGLGRSSRRGLVRRLVRLVRSLLLRVAAAHVRLVLGGERVPRILLRLFTPVFSASPPAGRVAGPERLLQRVRDLRVRSLELLERGDVPAHRRRLDVVVATCGGRSGFPLVF
mmetsp:Transcript_1136/g.4371  ORF Transcript_1136/g.4371 Transcript_1136/m.4371 type:complete len:263 (-) Transcript_1136:895-1683(-)